MTAFLAYTPNGSELVVKALSLDSLPKALKVARRLTPAEARACGGAVLNLPADRGRLADLMQP